MRDRDQTLDPASLEYLRGWIGSCETASDVLSPAPAQGLAATLDHAGPKPAEGSPVPALWHWLYFKPMSRTCELGADGHPERGGFMPPVPLPRRMWAGGRLAWEASNPLRLGDAVCRVSRIDSVTHKTGRSGELLFVTVRHEISNDQGPSLTEEQEIVYRAERRPGVAMPPPKSARHAAAWQRELTPDPVLLFRYSALTFNSHRIHYDRPYATKVEAYPGLVVQGPLIATLLMDLLRTRAPAAGLRRFEFSALQPGFAGRPMRLSGSPSADGREVALWAEDDEGRLSMKARAGLEA
jgi:3-methylfumaryl-CoA hydratase